MSKMKVVFFVGHDVGGLVLILKKYENSWGTLVNMLVASDLTDR